MPEAEGIAIGRLRWPVILVTRSQMAAIGTGIAEIPINVQRVHADIQPVGALTFWGTQGEQIDTPVTHRVFLRWIDYVLNTDAVLRSTRRRDGSLRFETFRVRRIREICGRKRFAILETELGKAS